MLIGAKNNGTVFGSGKVVIGYDLGSANAQISYSPFHSYEAETVSSVMGEEVYDIPIVLCKRLGVNQWYYGKEALKQAKEGNGILVEGLLEKARKGVEIVVEEEEYNPVLLLSLFVKKSLAVLSTAVSMQKIAGFMFTTDLVDETMVDIFHTITEGLDLRTSHIYLESHVESFYHYTIHQESDIWLGQVLACEYEKDTLITHRLEFNKNTTPIVAFSESERISGFEVGDRDRNLLNILHKNCDGRYVSSIQLIGNGFKGEWYQDSLKYMCVNRRVFAGNNLYSKGACYGILDRIRESIEGKKCLYLGKDKLKANIGMTVLRRGEESYLALLDAGQNWYDAKMEVEFLMLDGCEITFLISSLTGNKVFEESMFLEGLPERNPGTTRVRMQMEMLSDVHLHIMVDDLGFGEFFPSSNQLWQKDIELSV